MIKNKTKHLWYNSIIIVLLSSLILVSCERTPSGVKVSQAVLQDKWPLTVIEGYVDCIDNKYPVFRYDNKTYGLNSIARHAGYQSIAPIWQPSSIYPGAKKSIGPLINAAYKQCPSRKVNR